MDAFTFLLKVTILTAALIWGMQYKIDDRTIESHFVEFVHGSGVTEPIHRIAEGARKLSADGLAKVRELIGSTETASSGQNQSESKTTRKASSFKWQGE